MLRLILLALLPQVGGILLMVGRLPNSGIKVFATGDDRSTTHLSLHRPWVLLPEHAKVNPSDA